MVKRETGVLLHRETGNPPWAPVARGLYEVRGHGPCFQSPPGSRLLQGRHCPRGKI